MAKFYGVIGYVETRETEPGVYEEFIKERRHFGELIKFARQLESSDKINSDINLSNQISIIADPYAYEHFYAMRYITFMGAKWKISNVEVLHPRLILTIGGLYNGKD